MPQHAHPLPSLTRRTVTLVAMIAGLTWGALPMPSAAQGWPSKPIRLVVPFPAGGGTDIVARDVSNKITSLSKWGFVVDNKPGSGGNLGIDTVVKAPAEIGRAHV